MLRRRAQPITAVGALEAAAPAIVHVQLPMVMQERVLAGQGGRPYCAMQIGAFVPVTQYVWPLKGLRSSSMHHVQRIMIKDAIYTDNYRVSK